MLVECFCLFDDKYKYEGVQIMRLSFQLRTYSCLFVKLYKVFKYLCLLKKYHPVIEVMSINYCYLLIGPTTLGQGIIVY